MLDLIGANPFLTPRGVEGELNIAYNTVRCDLRRRPFSMI